MVLDQVVAFFDLIDRYKTWRDRGKNMSAESVAERFLRLFEAHGVHRNQIPRFFGHGLRIQDVQDEASLLSKLDDSILDAACHQFAVRREWLDGAERQAYICHHFYKEPQDFAQFITELKEKNPGGIFCGAVIVPLQPNWDAEALLILGESIGSVGDKEIHRYHLCDKWVFSYWKARTYLTACVAIAWSKQVYVHGIHAPQNVISDLAEGETLLGWQGEGIYALGGKRWDPEYMALVPAEFLKGVDPEKSNFGIGAGLKLWLALDQEGFMNTGLDKNIRPLFQQELEKYEKV